jgi:DNA-binding CsgD family transcriptional regulator
MLGRCGSPFRAREVGAVEEMLATVTVARASFGLRLPRERADLVALTPREREVLGYLCLGYTNREIALACATSPNTVRNQLASIFAKLGATTRAEAVAIAAG